MLITLSTGSLDLFWDTDNGGFYFTGSDAETPISREKEIVEGALPSGNSTAAVMLVHMAYLTGDTTYLDRVEDMHAAFYKAIDMSPAAGSFFLQSVLLMAHSTKEVVIFGDEANTDRNKLTTNLQQTFLPNVHVLTAEDPEQFAKTADFAASYTPVGDDATVYICENFACRMPETDVNKALQLIAGEASL